ncbi:MAG: dipeptidase [Bacteroidota bacterium]
MPSPRPRLLVTAFAALLGACADAPSGSPAPTDAVSEADARSEAETPPPFDLASVPLPEAVVDSLLAQDALWADALRIHHSALVVDGHVDTPSRMLGDGHRLGARSTRHHVDLPRMVEGGLDAAFFAAYVPRTFGESAAGTDQALALIDEVNRQVAGLDEVEIARTAADVRRITEAGRRAVLLALEGGHALQGDAAVLGRLAEAGVRYVTLTHMNTNAWADASTDVARWGGLNDLGRDLVREMNRLGVLADLSHVSDATFADVLAVSEAPVIVSHSSCRALFDHPRNVPDDLLRALARNGGVLMVNFYDAYLGDSDVTTEDVLDHLDHAIAVAGADHVGLGSDFDGVPSLPAGLEDATRLPWITYGMLRRGHSEAVVRKVLGENVLRVLEAAEAVADARAASG